MEPRCPYCLREGVIHPPVVEVMKIRTSTGVSFRCPEHGHCGARFDSMTREEILILLPQGHLTPARYPNAS